MIRRALSFSFSSRVHFRHMRVLVAMSGGVDSSVAAARLVQAGHDVVGVHLALSQDPQATRESARGCCSLEDSADARRVCDKLGIPFYVWDFSDRFKAEVIDNFVWSYEHGETPNPCLRCNEKIKFAALLERAIALGFDAIATGHYAIIDDDGNLRRSVDPLKDQSYVLGVLTRDELDKCVFPIGDTEKPQIREEAAAFGFSTAQKPDSYDICFIPDGNTQAFLGRSIGMRPGIVRDQDGTELKEHDGAFQYTIGQPWTQPSGASAGREAALRHGCRRHHGHGYCRSARGAQGMADRRRPRESTAPGDAGRVCGQRPDPRARRGRGLPSAR